MASCTSVLRNCFSCVARKELTASDVTDAGVKKIACVALSIFAGAAGTLLLGLVITKVLPLGALAIGLPFLFVAIGSAIYGSSIKDYDDPKEVQQMRDKAWGQDYRMLVSEHGAGPSVVKYSAPSAEAFIVKKGILSAEALQVKKEMHDEKKRYEEQLAVLNRKYPQRREKILNEYKKEQDRINQEASSAGQRVHLRKLTPIQTLVELDGIETTRKIRLKAALERLEEGIQNPSCEKQQKEYDQELAHLSQQHAEKENALKVSLEALHQEELRSLQSNA